MTIGEWLIKNKRGRLKKLKEILAPQIIIENEEKSLTNIENNKWYKQFGDLEYIGVEICTGRGGNEYARLLREDGPDVLYFPNARYGTFMTFAKEVTTNDN